MKNLIYLMVVSFTTIVLYSCSDLTSRTNNTGNTQNVDLRQDPNMNILWAEAILHRSYNPDPSGSPYGEVCDCKHCWGICAAKTPAGPIGNILIGLMSDDNEINDGQTRIYFGDPEAHFESEFGIDEDVIVDPEVLQNSDLNSLILKTGLYPSYQVEEEILVDGNWITVYGYVDVDDERE